MKKITYIAVACLFLFIISGCSKKYSEDDKDYVGKSPLARLYNYGNLWVVNGFFKNGADSTYIFSNGHHYSGFLIVGKTKAGVNIQYVYNSGSGTMNLTNNNNQLNIQYTPSAQYTFNPFINKNTTWDIEELTMDNLKIKTIIDGDNYELRFYSQKK